MMMEPSDYEEFKAELGVAIDAGLVEEEDGYEYNNEVAVDEVIKVLERWGLIIYTDVN